MNRHSARGLNRRAFLQHCSAGAAAALGAPLMLGANAVAAQATGSVSVGLLRAPASAIVDLCERKGWFAADGIKVESVLFAAASGPKILQALGSGSLGLSFVNSTAAVLALAGGAIPLRLISIPTDPSRNFAILSDASIESIPKLAGKRVAAPAGTALQYYLVRALTKYGMTIKDVEFVNLGAADAQAAFLAGRVDAVVPPVTGRFLLPAKRKDTRELFTYDDFTKGPGPTQPFLNYDLFVTTEEQLQKNRPALKAFLAAYHDRGIAYLNDPKTRDVALKLITDYVNTEQKTPVDASVMRKIVDLSRWYDRRTTQALMVHPDFRASLDYQAKFFMEQGMVKSPPDFDKAIVTDLL